MHTNTHIYLCIWLPMCMMYAYVYIHVSCLNASECICVNISLWSFDCNLWSFGCFAPSLNDKTLNKNRNSSTYTNKTIEQVRVLDIVGVVCWTILLDGVKHVASWGRASLCTTGEREARVKKQQQCIEKQHKKQNHNRCDVPSFHVSLVQRMCVLPFQAETKSDEASLLT